jgi:hypothetical protein
MARHNTINDKLIREGAYVADQLYLKLDHHASLYYRTRMLQISCLNATLPLRVVHFLPTITQTLY